MGMLPRHRPVGSPRRVILCATSTAGAPDYMSEMERTRWIEEFNSDEHRAELRQIAKRINDADGVDWSVEEISSVNIVGVDDEGITVEEVLCSTTDQRCIAVPLHVRWPTTSACPRTAAAMREAFAELTLRAFADADAD